MTARNNPNISNDLAQFDQTFGLPAPPSFQVVNQTGGTKLPKNNKGWASETALDVEWAHAIAPGANILVVEASASLANFIAAMFELAESGHVPVISAMGNLPIVRDLVVDMDPFWQKFKAMKPYLQPGYAEPPDGKEYIVKQREMNVIHKESLCINCGCCVSECNSMESDPDFLGPQALAKGMRFVGDPRDHAEVERLEEYNSEHGIWDCTRCYMCNERCPKGVDPRDAIAKLGAESIKLGIDRDMGAKHAKWFVTSAKTTGWLRETELVPKTQGIVSSIKQMKFAMGLAVKGKVPPPFPPHVAADVKESRALYNIVQAQGRGGSAGIVQGERALSRLEHTHGGGAAREPSTFPQPYLPDEVPAPAEEPAKKPGGGA